MSRLGTNLLLCVLLAVPCWPQMNPCRPELSIPLRARALSLIDSIVAVDRESLLKSLDKNGIMLGDNSPIPSSSVKRQFALKNGLFCLFFDSRCMNEPSNQSLWSGDGVLRELHGSYREWLKRAGDLRLEITFMDAPITKYCGASVVVRSHPVGVPATIELGFIYRNGFWKLAQIGDMP
jgi:hypothetical protein